MKQRLLNVMKKETEKFLHKFVNLENNFLNRISKSYEKKN